MTASITSPSVDAAPAGGDPLSEAHLQAIRDAKARRAKLDRATSVATFTAWTVTVLVILSAPFAPFSLSGFVFFLGLAAVAALEFRGRSLLRRLEAGGPRLLGINQVLFGTLIVSYCAWSLYSTLAGPNPYAEYVQSEPSLGPMLGDIEQLHRVIAWAVYGGTAVLTVPYQGCMAWYHFTRGKYLRAYVEQTPTWVTRMQRAAA